MKKLRILLLFLLLTICFSVPAFAFSGEGTEENPYLISSAADFAKMHEDLDGYYKLTCNINMAGVDYEPVGNESEGTFTGTLDGGGFIVSNLDLDLAGNKYVGVIGYLEGTVKNLTLKDVNANGYNYVGGIAGYAEDGSLIENCVVCGTVKGAEKISEISRYAGGIVGYGRGGQVKNCSSSGMVTGNSSKPNSTNYSGGIVGYNSGGKVTNCSNSGVVTGNRSYTNSGILSGGIVGYCSNFGSVVDCANGGSVFGTSAGGIVGSCNSGSMVDCTNSGSVSGSEAGGIVGYCSNSTVSGCANKGDVSASGSIPDAGGIVGLNYGTVTECINSGTVYCGEYAGGITGRCLGGSVTGCMNVGRVQGSEMGGGIAGYSSSNTISNCINTGRIQGTYYAGGITGKDGKVVSCVNSGFVSGGSRCGSIVGDSSYAITDSIYLAEVSRKSYSAKGTALPLSQFADSTSFPGLNFEDIWYIDSDTNSGFPQLRNLPDHLQLNECFVELTVGGTKKLSAVLNREAQSVVWSSDDETIAKVASDGTVTAKGVGVCTITATDAEGGKANCCIRVYQKADSATLNAATLALTKGSSATLTCTQNPGSADETVYWTSDNEAVATVGAVSGTVSAKQAGTATITATLLESGKTCTCTVTVTAPITGLSLSSSTASMKLGETKQLSLTVTPTPYDGSITWKSSDEAVATVSDSGLVSAVAPGTAVISAESDTGKIASCTVTVTAPVTEMDFAKASITLEKGLTEKLVLNILPLNTTDTISYSSSSTSYVTVSTSGVVTAQKVGTATITATASGGKKAYCTVNVIAANVPVTSVTLGSNEKILTRGDKLQLSASVLPSGATNKTLVWTSSDETVASVSNTGVITALSEGTTVIRAESINGMYDECIVSVISSSGPAVVLSATKGSPESSAEVTTSIVKNPGISAYRFTVNYDTSVLTPTAIIPNEDFGGTFESNLADDIRDNLTVLWYDTEDQTADGELFTVTFTVAKNAAVGTSTPVSLSWTAADICNQTGAHVALYQKNTAVEIAETLWGDVSGDGELTVYDLTLLARYVTELETFSARQLEIADIYADGEVDIRDVVKLAQTLLGLPEPMQLMQTLRLFSAPANEPQVSVGTASCAQDGEVRIPVYLSGNTGISGFRYAISYNADELELLSVEPAMESLAAHFSTNCGVHEDGQVIVSWYDTADMEEDGELFVITAKLKNGNTDISELHIEAAENNMCDAKLACVSADYREGCALTSAGLAANKSVDSGIFTCDVYCDETVAGSNRMAILALYGSNGQYLGCTSERIALVSGKNELRFSVSVATYSRYKLMLLDGTSYVPLLSGA